MSYAYEFSKRAAAQFRRLDVWLAEELLDELELLCVNPPHPRIKDPAGVVHEMIRTRGESKCYVFLTFAVDVSRQLIRINSVGQFVKEA